MQESLNITYKQRKRKRSKGKTIKSLKSEQRKDIKDSPFSLILEKLPLDRRLFTSVCGTGWSIIGQSLSQDQPGRHLEHNLKDLKGKRCER